MDSDLRYDKASQIHSFLGRYQEASRLSLREIAEVGEIYCGENHISIMVETDKEERSNFRHCGFWIERGWFGLVATKRVWGWSRGIGAGDVLERIRDQKEIEEAIVIIKRRTGF